MANKLYDFGQMSSVFYASVSPTENERIGPEALLGLCSSELPGIYDSFNKLCVCLCVFPVWARFVRVCMSEQACNDSSQNGFSRSPIYSNDNGADT